MHVISCILITDVFNNQILVYAILKSHAKSPRQYHFKSHVHTQMIRFYCSRTHSSLFSVLYHRHSTRRWSARGACWELRPDSRGDEETRAVIEREMLRKASRSTCLPQFCCVKSSSSQNKAPKQAFHSDVMWRTFNNLRVVLCYKRRFWSVERFRGC